jgi:hypothetical protein
VDVTGNTLLEMEATGLHFELLSTGRHVVLTKQFEAVILGGPPPLFPVTETVPAGFLSDFASSPRPAWVIVPPWGRYSPATVVHDYLYWIQRYTRKETDLIFYHHMRQLGVRGTRARLMYRAVRLGGWRPWQRYKNIQGYK